MTTAAYRSGSKIILKLQIPKQETRDKFQEVIFDYSAKKGIGFIQAITASNVPDWLKNRESLWQFVEDNYSKKKILACEPTFSLPEELSLEKNTSLALEYIEQTLLKIYQIVDGNIHNENSNNPHVYLMSPLIIFSKADVSGSSEVNIPKYEDIEIYTIKW